MKRREFISVLGTMALWPFVGRAQQQNMPVIGFLHAGTANAYRHVVGALRQGLQEAGYVDGQNVVIEFRWADNQFGRLPTLAADLVRHQVTVMVSGGGAPSALAVKGATSTIPIVVVFGSDPVKLGLAASLSRPGGNVTGVTFLATDLVGKRLELLTELVPHATTVAYLGVDPPELIDEQMTSDVLAAARTIGRQVIVVEVGRDRNFDVAFNTLVDRRADALIIASHSLLTSNRDKLVALAAHYKIPTIYQSRESVEAGGLMSYGASFMDAFRRGGVYVGQILKGAKPADLPFQQATAVELVINIKAAKALGLTVRPSLLTRADEVIE